jgi:uncharacterized C2H2 Zn-finger protein
MCGAASLAVSSGAQSVCCTEQKPLEKRNQMARARRATSKTRATATPRRSATKKKPAATQRKVAASSRRAASSAATLKCPECGRTFTRAASLGAHRHQAHGVAGRSANAANASRRPKTTDAGNGSSGRSSAANGGAQNRSSINRDELLASVFPAGIPAKEMVIRAVNSWLDEAERLSRLR